LWPVLATRELAQTHAGAFSESTLSAGGQSAMWGAQVAMA